MSGSPADPLSLPNNFTIFHEVYAGGHLGSFLRFLVLLALPIPMLACTMKGFMSCNDFFEQNRRSSKIIILKGKQGKTRKRVQ
jgi:hypothetical protein